MRKEINLTGQTFGSLTVLSRPGRMWECRCVCGNSVLCSTGNLRAKSSSARASMCQCSIRDGAKRRQTTHGLAATPEHRTWSDLRNRCHNPKNDSFESYGGRGITVDPRWDEFENFLSDMGPKLSPKHSLDRFPDNNGPYAPHNCRWATRREQNNNKRNNRILACDGISLTLAQWADRVGLTADALERRINLLKWPIEKALKTPPRGWGPGKPRVTAA